MASRAAYGAPFFAAAFALVVLWLIGFLGFNLNGIVHLLLVAALVALLLQVTRGNPL